MHAALRPSRRYLAALAVGALLCPLVARAAFPEKPIPIVVPYPPGGAADTSGRLVARHLQTQLPGSTVIVENKAGAGTAVADGYTLLTSSNTTWTMPRR